MLQLCIFLKINMYFYNKSMRLNEGTDFVSLTE